MDRVLVIDDDEETRTPVKRMLVRVGHQVEEAQTEGQKSESPTQK